jgi:hypothetical protein
MARTKIEIEPRNAAFRVLFALAVLLALSVVSGPLHSATKTMTTELVVADRLAGVALYGFDPVSYFLEDSARIGSESFEIAFGGLVWRFRSEGNRAAFRAHPDAFVPRFGGYDPIALAHGAPVAGNPSLFAVHGDELYLFHRPETLLAFTARPDAAISEARRAWPVARRLLVR